MNLAGRKPSLMKCLAAMDLTSLNNSDTDIHIADYVRQINEIHRKHPDLPHPASVCVFPNFASVVKKAIELEGVKVTAVSGAFPHSQSFTEVKELETVMALDNGADEIDTVLSLKSFFESDYNKCKEEILSLKDICRKKSAEYNRNIRLKVILETGILESEENIRKASFLALESGADFIKTSTGKITAGASPMAAIIMCQCISDFYKSTSIKAGFKAAGGISTLEDALIYFDIVKDTLGEEWTEPSLFRLGTSRLHKQVIETLI